jgi:hypothetical protein
MKLRLAMGFAAIFTLTVAPAALSEEAAERSCEEIRPSAFARLSPGNKIPEGSTVLVRGVRSCKSANGGANCTVSDPGKITIVTRTAIRVFKAPRGSKVWVAAHGEAIYCRVVGA